MSETREFADEELKALTQSRFTLAREAIRCGNKEEAEMMLQAARDEAMVVHDVLRDWLTDICSEVGRQFGDDALHEIMLKTVRNYLIPLKNIFKKGFRECVEATAAIWRAHFSDFGLYEDDDKVTFVLKPCGSGGRQIGDGKYGPPLNLLRIKDPQVMTGQSRDCPVYCAHCVAMTEAMLDEDMGCVFVVDIEDGKEDPDHLFHIYKDASRVPGTVYERLGRQKHSFDK